MNKNLLLVSLLLAAAASAESAPNHAQTRVVAWGPNTPRDLLNAAVSVSRGVEVAAAANHVLVRTATGKVFAWGNYENMVAKNMPKNLPPVISIAAGREYSAVVTAGGRVVTWGHPPAFSVLDTVVPRGVRNISEVAAGEEHLLALRKNGTVVSWTVSGTLLPTPKMPEKLKQIGIAGTYNIGLGVSGKLYRWGRYTDSLLPKLTVIRQGVVSFASSYLNIDILALDKNGKVAAFTIVGTPRTVPLDLRRAVDVAVGSSYNVALLRNGSIHPWGKNHGSSGLGFPPSGLRNVKDVAAGQGFAVALVP